MSREVRVQFLAAQKRRVADPAWPGGGFPVPWLQAGVPQELNDDLELVSVPVDKYDGLAHLTYGRNGNAYMRSPSSSATDPVPELILGRIVDHVAHPDLVHLRFWRLRRGGFPTTHNLNSGEDGSLDDFLDDDDAIAEANDIIIFPDSCLVAAVVNRDGPSRRAALQYLADKSGLQLRLTRLVREDALALLDADRIRSFEAEVLVGHQEALMELGESIESAAAASGVPGARTVTVGVRFERKDNKESGPWLMERARSVLSRDRDEGLRKFNVGMGPSDEADLPAEVVDLLDMQIGHHERVTLERGRTVTEEGALSAALQGLDENRAAIARAIDGLDLREDNQRMERRKRSEG